MPSLTITLTDAQSQRLLSCGAFDEQDANGVAIPATRASVQRKILRYIRAEVLRAELGKVAGVAEATRRTDMTAEGW